MRVLLVAPCRVPVTRDAPGAGGQVALLAEALAARGHEVTVCTSMPAALPVRVHTVRLPAAPGAPDIERLTRLYAVRALLMADGYDVVHSFAGPELVLAADANVPLLTTVWGVPAPAEQPLWRQVRGRYVGVSWAQMRRLQGLLPAAVPAGVVYPALDVEAVPYEPEKDDYLLLAGPIGPDAGTDLALAGARKTELPLLILGPVAPGAGAFFAQEVAPRLDGRLVRYRPVVGRAERRRLVARARALLMLSRSSRPWLPLAAEALAMGTPVILLGRGPARELVVHAETGFVVDDLIGLVSAIDRLDSIDPLACRRRAARCWDVPQAALAYERLYQALHEPTAAPTPHPELAVLGGGVPNRAAEGAGPGPRPPLPVGRRPV